MKLIPCILLSRALLAQAGDVQLAWDPSPDTNVTYRVYAHTNESIATNVLEYSVRVNAGTNLTAKVDELANGVWFFVATAVSPEDVESDPSNMVVYTIRPGRPTALIILSSTNLIQWQEFWRLKIE